MSSFRLRLLSVACSAVIFATNVGLALYVGLCLYEGYTKSGFWVGVVRVVNLIAIGVFVGDWIRAQWRLRG